MASSTRSESPVDIDFSVIRTSIQMGHKMIDQILQGIHYGSEEVRNLLREECDFIMECKVCRNLFRSFPNFVAHKRVYCMEYYEEKLDKDNLAPVPADEETVVIHPEAPEENTQKNKNENASSKSSFTPISSIEKVVNKTFDGKSKEYQLYTKVAEDLEKRKATKVTNTVVLTPIEATSNAVKVTHAKGDKSSEIPQRTSPKKQSPMKPIEEVHSNSPAKKKNSVIAVCADLAKKKLMQDGKVETINALPLKTRTSARSRKSSPRKSTEYLEMSNNGKSSKSNETEEFIDVEEWNGDRTSPDRKVRNENINDKELLKLCDLKNFSCRACHRKCKSLWNLKLHIKIQHGLTFGKFPCCLCESKFEHLKSLVKHLRHKHNKNEQYIASVKTKFLPSKTIVNSTEDMEVDDDNSSSTSSSASPASPVKDTRNMLSFSTGWKKCDKCGKVCWKAKSFYRHYSQCKGPGAKSESESTSNSLVKSGKQTASGSQKNTTALLKLQEKLRAGVIQPDSSDVKSKPREKISKSESESKGTVARDKASAERYVDSTVASSELFKVLTQPLNVDSQDARSKLSPPQEARESGQSKTYNLRLNNQTNEKEEKASVALKKETHVTEVKVQKESEKSKEVQPAFKELEERLVREAGLKDTQAELKDSQRNEIKLLEEKLTREALGHDKNAKDAKEKESSESTEHDVKENKDINESKRTINTTKESIKESKEESDVDDGSDVTNTVETGRCSKHASNKETENRKEVIAERLREKMASQEHMTHISKTRSSRSVSRESEHTVQGKTPEKLNLMTNISPVSSPGRSSILPSSPTPSLQSNYGDSYNMKFKMTVQEMAELVESASLTKFAKERKKRAKSFLNSKQVKDSQKIATSLSKPMKRGAKKKNIVIRNVYGTRNKASTSDSSEEKRFIPSSDLNAEDNDDKQGSSRRLSREQKRLQNSAGFVEKNFYAVTSSRDSSKDRQSDADSEKRTLSRERKRLENSQGFVEKGFHYESDSSIERDKHSLRRPYKSHNNSDAERSADEDFIKIDNEISVSSKSPIVQCLPMSELEVSTEPTGKEKSKEVKETNVSSFKKTVLYVGKDFTEKIKSIQQKTSDTISETSEKVVESDFELRSKNKSEISSNESLELRSKNKSEISPKESHVDKVQQQSVEKNSESKEDIPKHRTRLATGSIFFDSELLKLSPTKIEKKIAELNKAKEETKGRHEKEEKSKESESVKRKLSLSPRKAQVEKHIQHLRSKSGPQRFSLATGVVQCQKCNKTFWKKKAYVFHLVNSSCRDKSLSKLDRKRALSLSPEGTMVEESRYASVKRMFKKPKRDVNQTGKKLKEDGDATVSSDKTTRDARKEPIRMTRNQAGNSAKSFGNKEVVDKTKTEVVDKTKTEVVDKTSSFQVGSKEKDKSDEIEQNRVTKSSARLSKEVTDQQKELVKEDRTLRKKMNDQDKTVVTVKKNITSSFDDPSNMEVEGSKVKTFQESNISKDESVVKESDINKNDTIVQSEKFTKFTNKSKEVKISDKSETVKSVVKETFKTRSKLNESLNIKTELSFKSGIPVSQEKTGKSDEGVNKEQVASNIGSLDVSEEVPSTSLPSIFTDDSDDNSSDFSGFSEEDLKLREHELSQMDVVEELEDMEDELEENMSDVDFGELSDHLGSGIELETDPDPKPDSQSASPSQRPVRKSAQNRFGHTEEIFWVYKEPGKPVERTKYVKNREYVMDVSNPWKLHCHNSKDVDRLIDEKGMKCIQCDTPCTSISNLRRHVIRHLGWKRYKCKHCPYTCYDMSYCRQHVLRAHGENLTTKNFHSFILDLKKEATKKRAAKRTNTLHKTRQNSADDDVYKKTRTNVTPSSSIETNVNTEQTKVIIPNVSVSKSNTNQSVVNSKSRRSKDSQQTVAANERSSIQSNILVKSEPIDISSVKKEVVKVQKKTSAEGSPLDKARMNLVKALRDK